MEKDKVYQFPNQLSEVLDRIFGEVAVNTDTVSDVTDEEVSEVDTKLEKFSDAAWPILLRLAEEHGIILNAVSYDYTILISEGNGKSDDT